MRANFLDFFMTTEKPKEIFKQPKKKKSTSGNLTSNTYGKFMKRNENKQ
jgi:hypothetical protein